MEAKELIGKFSRIVLCNRVTIVLSYVKAMWGVGGVTYHFSTSYHPPINGFMEIFNKTLKTTRASEEL